MEALNVFISYITLGYANPTIGTSVKYRATNFSDMVNAEVLVQEMTV